MSAPDLSTTWMGLELSGPLVASACPLTGDVESARRLEDAGVSAIVMPSLFQEQVEHEELELGRLRDFGAESYGEASDYFPELAAYNTGPDGYLRLVEDLRGALSIPVVASLNGVSADGWARHARAVVDAGAHAVELNLHHVPTDPDVSSAEVEESLLAQVSAVRGAVDVPVSVKLGAHLTAPVHLARRMGEVGANGVVVFNRAVDPDLDVEALQVVPRLELSRSSEMRASLRWIAILSARTDLSLASTGGVHSAEDALKLLLAGANVVTLASALLLHGPSFARGLLDGLSTWLSEHEYDSVAQLIGSMNLDHCPDPSAYERGGYMRALTSFTSPMP